MRQARRGTGMTAFTVALAASALSDAAGVLFGLRLGTDRTVIAEAETGETPAE